ncbi:hypothetical protein LCGC14_2720730, partial [marine sediment metagenome]
VGVYNGSGDAKVQVKEAIDTMPTSGVLEIAGDEYAYTSLDTANKAFNLSGVLSRDYVEDDAVYVQTTIRNLKLSGIFDNLDRIKAGTDYGRNIIFDGNAALPAGAYNGTGDGIVRVKESIDNLPTSGVLEIAGDEYAYTTVTIADKEFNLSGTLSTDYAEDDAVYVQTVIRNVAVTGNAAISGNAAVTGDLTVSGVGDVPIKDQGGVAANGLKCKVLAIGTWDMTTTNPKTVAHGIGDSSKIRSVSIMIHDEVNDWYLPFSASFSVGGADTLLQYVIVDDTNVKMYQDADGFFDTTNYNGAGDRGTITIWYEA